ncbi:MAG: SMP-30/gluconolactonase/LRE family protein [Solirubrobacteraceae bacterium]
MDAHAADIGFTTDAFEVWDDRFERLLHRESRLERLWSGAQWSEGPVYLPAEDCVLWSDIPNDRVLRWSEHAGVSVELHPAGFANGHAIDLQGRVVRCEHGGRRISRVESDGSVVTVVDNYRGARLNSPNDVVVKSDGTIWFTDPPYGILSDREGHRANSELGGNYVFRFDPGAQELAIVSDALEEPNGLAFSPDESVLYVSDTSAALRKDGTGNHHILAFDVIDGERLLNPRVFAVVSPGLADGFRVDVAGNVFTSSADGIHVYAPDGTRLGRIGVPEVVSNCAFGGPERDRLFITASASLYAIRLATRGAGVRAQ